MDQSDFRTHYVLYKIVILLTSRHTDQATDYNLLLILIMWYAHAPVTFADGECSFVDV